MPFGIAFGLLRGACQVPGCLCESYKTGPSGCTCGHFPASHKNLGQASLLQEAELEDTEEGEGAGHEPLRKKTLTQVEEWPQVLNKKAVPYEGALATLQQTLLGDQPEWIIRPDEVEFTAELGKGTAASVYKGTYLRQPVAIKMMDFRLGGKDTEKLIKDLEHEFDIMTQVRSQHVVNLLGVVAVPRVCMVVELCVKGSLTSLLQRADLAFSWPLLFKWYKETVEGIGYLHHFTPQIVHRDIKTLNLLVTETNAIKVADFGLSRFVAGEASTSTLAKLRGTYCYTAPEIYFGHPYTTKSDVYSLGIVLWELVHRLVTGKHQAPFAEFTHITFDFQIIIQAAKKDMRCVCPSWTSSRPSQTNHSLRVPRGARAAD